MSMSAGPSEADEKIAKTCEDAANTLARLHSCGEAGSYCDSDVHTAISVLRNQADEARAWHLYGVGNAPDASSEGEGDFGYIVDCRNGPSDYAYFWRPGGAGYTPDLSQAGIYTRAEYEGRLGPRCAQMAFVPRELAEAIARPTVRFDDLHERGIRRESWRRKEFETEEQAETLRTVFG